MRRESEIYAYIARKTRIYLSLKCSPHSKKRPRMYLLSTQLAQLGKGKPPLVWAIISGKTPPKPRVLPAWREWGKSLIGALWRCYTRTLLEISHRTRWWCLKCVIVYLARDILPFVMYCVNGKPRSSLLIESTDPMILILILQWTYRDSALSSDARLHVNPIHFLA